MFFHFFSLLNALYIFCFVVVAFFSDIVQLKFISKHGHPTTFAFTFRTKVGFTWEDITAGSSLNSSSSKYYIHQQLIDWQIICNFTPCKTMPAYMLLIIMLLIIMTV